MYVLKIQDRVLAKNLSYCPVVLTRLTVSPHNPPFQLSKKLAISSFLHCVPCLVFIIMINLNNNSSNSKKSYP